MVQRSMWRLGAACLLFLALCSQTKADYQIGVGIADSTGPAAGIIFMGYAKLTQRGYGLHLRQWSRAFIIDDGTNRIVFVSVDTGMVGYGIKEAVIENLEALYGDTYTVQNVIISGTHTHSTPGGFMDHLLFDITILGHVKQTFEALVEGITGSIIKAHDSMVTGKIYINSGTLLNANINRSPASYDMNPDAEKELYSDNVDKEMVQLKFVNSESSEVIGAINWFPVHPVSMNNTNGYITSDNVGYAAILMEKDLNGGAFPGQGSVVTAFASTNLGDVSPNINGPICTNTGEECEYVTSTCDGEAQFCIASGPGDDMFESTRIIAERMYGKAVEILEDTAGQVEVTGAVSAINQFVDMPAQIVTYTLGDGNEINGTGCIAAMGYSFAAGTTDGPGEFDFVQGTTSTNLLWEVLRDLLAPPTEEDVECQAPKPILLATGQMVEPYDWHPRVVSTQLAFIGNVAIAAVPGEFTTMAGRRLKNVIKSAMSSDATVIIAGLSNHYTHYVTTYEEYQLQRYEGASTIYGPHTLGIYLNQYEKLAEALVTSTVLEPGPEPYVFDRDKLFSLVFPVILDHPDLNTKYGTCILQPPSSVTAGTVVTAKFVAGHPRNNLMHDSTFLRVERLDGDEWVLVANDAVWETKYRWERTYLAASEATIEWTVPEGTIPGTYRMQYFGAAKSLFGRALPHSGTTNTFTVI
ncbi:ceramidase [Holotrichia oblita]|uniref:Ceramidase n=1 Tax=Holotrichia oblita TaxID=644536 RepID=A0ACB9SWI9_HOLOL|nr:ceramidase [Holotrichia oblita]